MFLFLLCVCVCFSDGMSGLELPDLVTEPLTHVIRGMSRRRPPPTFNISVFEKQLDQPTGPVSKHHLDINFYSIFYRMIQ